MEKHFELAMQQIRSDLITMATRAEEAVRDAVKSFVTRDTALAQQVIENDTEINEHERAVDQAIFTIEALAAPVAMDLRFLFAAEKINKDIERIGDHAVNIAQAAIRVVGIDPAGTIGFPAILETMASCCRSMLNDTITCFIESDTQKALSVLEADEQVDTLCASMEQAVVAMIRNHVETVEVGLVLTYVAHNLERVGDLSTNIAEDVIFHAQAKDVKHHHLDEIPAGN